MNATKIVGVALLAVALAAPGWAQYSVTDPSIPVTEDFTGFTGSGFASSPAAGQLDSDNIIVTGLSDGDMSWGGTYTSGDYARGQSSGGVTSGGIYGGVLTTRAAGSNEFLMFQPGSSDLTPGDIIFRFVNNTGAAQDRLAIDYTILVYNDQARANSIQCQYSADGTTWAGIGPYDYTSPEAADSSPSWQTVTRNGYVLVVNVAAGATFYLRWHTDDSTGSGSRDELGLDDISIRLYSDATPTDTATPTTAPTDTATPVPTAAPISIVTASNLPGAATGDPYSVTLQASGGTPPYTWSLTAGALPAGLTLDGSAGTISGTPSERGTFNFTIQVADSQSVTTTKDFTLTVRAIGIPTIGNRGALAFILILLSAGVLIVLRRRLV